MTNSRKLLSTYVDGMKFKEYVEERSIGYQPNVTDYISNISTKPYLNRLTKFTNKHSNQYYIARALYTCINEILPELAKQDFDTAKKMIIEELASGKIFREETIKGGKTVTMVNLLRKPVTKIADLDIKEYFDQYPEFKEVWDINANSKAFSNLIRWFMGYVSDYLTAIYNRTTYAEVLGFVVENIKYKGDKVDTFVNMSYNRTWRVSANNCHGRSAECGRAGFDWTFRTWNEK